MAIETTTDEQRDDIKIIKAEESDSLEAVQAAYNIARYKGHLVKVVIGGVPITRDKDDEFEENWAEADS